MASLSRVEIAFNKAYCVMQLVLLPVISVFVFYVQSCGPDDAWSFDGCRLFEIVVLSVATMDFCRNLKWLRSDAPGLEFDEHGLIDRSRGFWLRIVAWADISEVKIIRPPRRGRMLAIRLKDSTRVATEGSDVLKAAKNLWSRISGHAVYIPEHVLKIDLDELLTLTERYLAAYAADERQAVNAASPPALEI